MSKPVYFRWADDDPSATNTPEPTTYDKDVGFRPGTEPPAPWFNWAFNLIGQWLKWFDGLFSPTLGTSTPRQILSGSGWEMNGLVYGPNLVTVPTNGGAGKALLLPHGALLSSLTVGVMPSAHAALPQTKPNLSLFVQNNIGGAMFPIPQQADPSATPAAYSAAHEITLSFNPPLVIDRSLKTYTCAFSGESGTNAAPLTLNALTVNCATPRLDELAQL